MKPDISDDAVFFVGCRSPDQDAASFTGYLQDVRVYAQTLDHVWVLILLRLFVSSTVFLLVWFIFRFTRDGFLRTARRQNILASTPWFSVTCNKYALCNETGTMLTFFCFGCLKVWGSLTIVWNVEAIFVWAFLRFITVWIKIKLAFGVPYQIVIFTVLTYRVNQKWHHLSYVL